MFQLPSFEASLVARAISFLDWNARFQFCAACGSSTTTVENGYKKQCSNLQCVSASSIQNYSHPRLDPVAIAAVQSCDRKRLLLGRQAKFPKNVYSCLAGFIEPGETVEQAAAREVLEESGIVITNIQYHSSQPWPFPSQLMLGCLATAQFENITIDRNELEDVKWFTKDDVILGLNGAHDELKIPPPYAIAHTLIKAWAFDAF